MVPDHSRSQIMTRENYFKTHKCYSITRISTKRSIKERLKEFFIGIAAGIFGIIVILACSAAIGWILEEAPRVVPAGIIVFVIFAFGADANRR